MITGQTYISDETLHLNAWQMFTILVRLKNIAPDHPLVKSEIYKELSELVDSMGYK